MLQKLKNWAKENRPAFNFYILSDGVFLLGVAAIVCALMGRKDLIDPVATVIGAIILVALCIENFTYPGDEYEESEAEEC